MRLYQQGDVLIEEYDGDVVGELQNECVLAHGETTGHAHRIHNGAQLYVLEGQMFLKVLMDNAVVTHEEHGHITIPRGNYRVRKVVEYDHFAEEAREVRD